ncbi:MAG TPA: hypothetical protein VF240_03445, partial [Pyrinomonadaceae bacterium]
ILLCGVAAASAHAQTDASLVGTWQAKGPDGPVVVKLNADGTGSLDGTPFSYVVRGDKIDVTANGVTTPYDFKLTGGVLSVSGAGQSYIFERVGGGEGKASGVADEKSSARARNPLVGRWLSDEDTVDIREDGTLYLSGMKMTYKIEGDRITVSTGEGDMVFPFRMKGDDKFSVTIEGREREYDREKEGPGGGGGLKVSEGAGANPRELAGKWCYMANVNNYAGGRISNRCFTLREDGTYDFNAESSSSGPVASSASQESDTGTWTATATTITSRSSKTGTNIYKLERRNHPKNGDPMLVLDGDAYVTATQRPSWP